ncbi:hypothetical protein [Paludisphaera rhizosphaerae]|uniref:hypothetical protein n=1 Tax=Paludisphaera rhizosphaerae TaxID=2711216 RepID=UPI0013EDAE55|nr:hypothetical protein [Paludisphaera rhizosphaerae]
MFHSSPARRSRRLVVEGLENRLSQSGLGLSFQFSESSYQLDLISLQQQINRATSTAAALSKTMSQFSSSLARSVADLK